MKRSLLLLAMAPLYLFFLSSSLEAEFLDEKGDDKVCGKIDIGPTVMRVELLDCGKRHKKMDLYGYRADGCWLIYEGWCLKPMMLMGWGEGSLYTLSCSFGRCIPFCNEKFFITPFVGYSWSYVTTDVDIEVPTLLGPLRMEGLEEKFRGTSPYVGLDLLFNVTKCWRISATFQYGFSRSWTKIKEIGHHCHSNSKGPAYGFQVERDLNKKMSINCGFGYNCSYAKDKSGLRGKGAKIGFVYWF